MQPLHQSRSRWNTDTDESHKIFINVSLTLISVTQLRRRFITRPSSPASGGTAASSVFVCCVWILLTVSPSWPAVPFMGGVTSTSTLELFGRFLSVGRFEE